MDIENKYPLASARVSGLLVRKQIPNIGSIESSLDDYEILKGIREVPFAAFTELPPLRFHNVAEERRTHALAEQIHESQEINPLIVVEYKDEDYEGPYVLEGGHRFDALQILKVLSFPALVVLDVEALGMNESENPNDMTREELLRELTTAEEATAEMELASVIDRAHVQFATYAQLRPSSNPPQKAAP